jgi:hypothetical protein
VDNFQDKIRIYLPLNEIELKAVPIKKYEDYWENKNEEAYQKIR